jgi:two-component sensor histidine kinase
VEDDGVGLPDKPYTEGLGLQIVRTLVTSELAGTIQWQARTGGGTAVQIVLDLATQ